MTVPIHNMVWEMQLLSVHLPPGKHKSVHLSYEEHRFLTTLFVILFYGIHLSSP